MADETKPSPPGSGGRHSKMVPVIVVALLMIGEGVGVYFVADMISADPVAAAAADLDAAEGADGGGGQSVALAEVEVAECRPSNKTSGRLYSFQLRVLVLVPQTEVERVSALIEERGGRLRDRINFVVRSAELQHLNEPGLETLKRGLKREFDRIFEDDSLVQEVLVPELLQSAGGV